MTSCRQGCKIEKIVYKSFIRLSVAPYKTNFFKYTIIPFF